MTSRLKTSRCWDFYIFFESFGIGLEKSLSLCLKIFGLKMIGLGLGIGLKKGINFSNSEYVQSKTQSVKKK